MVLLHRNNNNKNHSIAALSSSSTTCDNNNSKTTTSKKYFLLQWTTVLVSFLCMISIGHYCFIIMDMYPYSFHHHAQKMDASIESSDYWARLAQNELQLQQTANNTTTIQQPYYYEQRPKNLHLAFVGDSVTRYMYLSFVYFCKFGMFVNNTEYPNFLNSKHFEGWNEFYNYTTTILGTMEECNCYRHTPIGQGIRKETTIENRYFVDRQRNNSITYIQVFGGSPSHGHWNSSQVQQQHYTNMPLNLDWPQPPFAWSYNWSSLIRYHLAQLPLKPQYVVLNEGLWVEHQLHQRQVRNSISKALDDTGIMGIYKTSTAPYLQRMWGKIATYAVFRRHDGAMCRLFGGKCLDLSWTTKLDQNHRWDKIHFLPHVNKVMVLQLLDLLYNHSSLLSL